MSSATSDTVYVAAREGGRTMVPLAEGDFVRLEFGNVDWKVISINRSARTVLLESGMSGRRERRPAGELRLWMKGTEANAYGN